MFGLSPTASSLITLLNNVNELIVYSSDRQNANEVMHALNTYAKSKSFPLPQDKIDNFYSILLDSKPYTLTSVVMDIAEDVLITDKELKRYNPNQKLP